MGQFAESRSPWLSLDPGLLVHTPTAPNPRALVANWRLLHWRFIMLRWALGLLLAALVTGFFAFLGLASPVEAAARVLFVAFLAGFFVTLVAGLIGGRKSGA
jgi:uncharacterized membrane protein YtjA (UPF0391 family)